MRLIDADALKKPYERLEHIDPHEYIPPREVIADIDEAPTIDAKPVVHGEWDFIGDYDSRCSVCGEEYCIGPNEDYNFCPNCGADMRERKET